jgi:hypothetical protein
MATATITTNPAQPQVTQVPEWKIRELLFQRASGATFLGIQKALDPKNDLVLFIAPGSGSTLAVPRAMFDLDVDIAVVVCQHRIFTSMVDMCCQPGVPD